jgi:hypothetical protein
MPEEERNREADLRAGRPLVTPGRRGPAAVTPAGDRDKYITNHTKSDTRTAELRLSNRPWASQWPSTTKYCI